jgi:hypothetical protein
MPSEPDWKVEQWNQCKIPVIARSVSDEAIQIFKKTLDCFASLAMTKTKSFSANLWPPYKHWSTFRSGSQANTKRFPANVRTRRQPADGEQGNSTKKSARL